VLLDRHVDEERLRAALGRAPVVLLTGPRQSGKSTLARTLVSPPPEAHFDLEDRRDLARLGEPTLSLTEIRAQTIVLDEAQRSRELFPVLRVLVDEDRRPGRFLVLGSASPDLVGLASESLAGLPPSFLAGEEADSRRWRAIPRSAPAGRASSSSSSSRCSMCATRRSGATQAGQSWTSGRRRAGALEP
jgi:hypothetical protein